MVYAAKQAMMPKQVLSMGDRLQCDKCQLTLQIYTGNGRQSTCLGLHTQQNDKLRAGLVLATAKTTAAAKIVVSGAGLLGCKA